MASSFPGIGSPIRSRDIDINMVCDDSMWKALSEPDWRSRVNELASEAIADVSLHAAMRALIARDTMADCRCEYAPKFSQYILLCSMLETITLAQKSAASYSSLDAWQNRRMEAVIPEEQSDRSLGNVQESVVGKSRVYLADTSPCAS